MVAEIFLLLRLGSSVCVVWCTILFPDVRSSSSQPLNPGQHYLFQALDVGLCVESEAMWDDERRYNITSVSDNPTLNDEDGVFCFHYYRYIL